MEMLGRPVAVDWSVAKEVYAEVAKPTQKQERETKLKEKQVGSRNPHLHPKP